MLSASFSRRNCWIKGNAEWRKNSTIQLQEIDLRRIILERIRLILRTRGKIQLRKYFNFIPRPLDAARRQELFHALSPSPDLFDARNPPLEFPPHPSFSLSFSFISFDGSRSFDTHCTCRARVDACWRLEDSSANARIRIGPCSERKRGVTHARINRPVAFQDPSSRIVSRWPQGLKEEGVGQRCWNKKRDYIVRLQGCNFSVIRFLSFWFVLVFHVRANYRYWYPRGRRRKERRVDGG